MIQHSSRYPKETMVITALPLRAALPDRGCPHHLDFLAPYDIGGDVL
ncbi:hypothetical protein OLX23_25210 [Novosphingobium sp. JCM 18896]|nr:hypothetical protein [Novosphingobium sp. JCM 18896]